MRFLHEREPLNFGERYVAPIQILLDGSAIGGVVADIARREAQSW